MLVGWLGLSCFCHYDVLICLVVAKLPGGAWFLNRNRVKNFTLFSLIFLYCSSSMEIRERKKEIMPLDVFSLVMAFLTSATSLAAALVQFQTAKIAAQGTKKRPNRRRGHQKAPQPPPRAPETPETPSAPPRARGRIIARLGAKKTPIGVLDAKKAVFFASIGRKICKFFAQ
jgi:hypothetical protein